MNAVRTALSSTIRAKRVLNKIKTPLKIHRVRHHDDGPPQPFDNMPFSIPNRYVATIVFAFFFGIGLWSPYAILWYLMAKRTM